jgi:hypothetical protein
MKTEIYESNKILPYVYLLTHKRTGQFYIGSRWSKRQKFPSHIDIFHYKTSSKIVKPKFDEFEVKILAEFYTETRYKDSYDFEQYLINEFWGDPLLLNKVNCYNNEKRLMTDYDNRSEEEKNLHRQRISEATKRNWDKASEEDRQKFKDNVSYYTTEIWNNRSEEDKKEIADKISKTWKEKSEDEKNKTKNNISKSVSMKCMIYGKVYNTRNEAAEDLNIKLHALRKRLNSDDYKDYIDLSNKGIRKTRKINIKGTIYSSIRKASESENIPRKRLKNLLESDDSDFEFVD